MALKKFQSTGGGGFWKPADAAEAVAILVEPKAFEADRPIPGKGTTVDTMFADITVFANKTQLDGKSEPAVHKMVGFSQKALVSDAKAYLDEAFVVTLGQYRTKMGNAGWKFEPVDEDVEAKVEKYMEKRDSAIEEAMDDAPPF